MMDLRKSFLGLAAWAALVAMVSAIGSQAMDPGIWTWYPALVKPSWTPPSSVFGPVWTGLYAMMTVAVWRVWRTYGWTGARAALTIFIVQLFFNGAWSWIFFSAHRLGAAAIEIIFLWGFILGTTVAFWRKDRAAGLLMLPYLAWVLVAAALNISMWTLNARRGS